MKIAAAFLTDNEYVKGCQVAAYSFIKNNPWFKGDIIIYLSEDISEKNKLMFTKFYPNIIFKYVRTSDYEELLNNVNINEYLIKAFYKFEVFAEDEYDKVIFIDSDITVIGDIREILEWGDFTVPIDTELHDVSFNVRKRSNEYINTGFFVIGKKYLGENIRNELINYTFTHDMSIVDWYNPWGGAYADQCLLSTYFADKNIDVCSNIYNQKFYYFKEENKGVVKLIHYLGDNKPWLEGRVNDEFWRECYREMDYDEYSTMINGNIYFFEKDRGDKDKYIVCGCAKNEDEYIEEWVNHHLQIGFDKIIIADNNDDESILPSILKEYIENNQVQIFPCKGLSSLQLPIYKMMMDSKNFKWMACFDVDEFLELSPKYSSIKEILDETEEDCLLVNWLMYGSNGQVQKLKGGVQERFKNPVYPIGMFKENMFFKPIISNKIHDAYFTSSHAPTFEKGGKFNIGGYYVEENGVFQTSYPVRYKKLWLKHYYTKSFEEYMNKVNRGWPDFNDVKRLQNLSHYFLIDKSDEVSLSKFDDHIFTKNETSWVWDILNDYNVILYLNPTKNYFSLLYHLGKSMSLVSGHTFIVEEDIDDNIFIMLFEIAQRTGNQIVACDAGSSNYWDLYKKYNNGLGDTYYVVTIS